jgi:hypothetical protein
MKHFKVYTRSVIRDVERYVVYTVTTVQSQITRAKAAAARAK